MASCNSICFKYKIAILICMLYICIYRRVVMLTFVLGIICWHFVVVVVFGAVRVLIRIMNLTLHLHIKLRTNRCHGSFEKVLDEFYMNRTRVPFAWKSSTPTRRRLSYSRLHVSISSILVAYESGPIAARSLCPLRQHLIQVKNVLFVENLCK